MNKIIISPLHFTIDNQYNYNVQVLTSIDGGRTFVYCGIGKYAKDEEDIKRVSAILSEKYHTNIIERRAQGV